MRWDNVGTGECVDAAGAVYSHGKLAKIYRDNSVVSSWAVIHVSTTNVYGSLRRFRRGDGHGDLQIDLRERCTRSLRRYQLGQLAGPREVRTRQNLHLLQRPG